MRTQIKMLLIVIFLLGFTIRPALATQNVVVVWDNAALQAIRNTHPGPPIVARALAIVHTAIYDAWSAYDPVAVGTTYSGKLRRPDDERTDSNKAKALSFSAYRTLVDLFPTEKSLFDNTMSSLGYDPSDTTTDTSTPAGIGNVTAQAVLDFRHHDGSNQLGDLNSGTPYSDYTGYTPVNDPDNINDPNRWQPLRVSDGHGGTVVQKFIAPHWGKVTPYAIKSLPKLYKHIPDPQFFGGKEYKKQAKEVIEYSANLTDEQKVIAEYWADGPSSELPPGHWALFAQYVSERDDYNIDDATKMYFALTNAIFDASILAWDVKRHYDYVRPVTAIHYLFKDKYIKAWAGPLQGTQKILGQDWEPYQASTVVTPPFSEYFSGHSIFSAAGAETLKRFTGSDHFGQSVTIPAGSSRVEPNTVPAKDVTLFWKTFSDAADEAGISRRYGGIHFIQGDLVAREMGRKLGKIAWKKSRQYFNGKAH